MDRRDFPPARRLDRGDWEYSMNPEPIIIIIIIIIIIMMAT